MYFDCIQDCAYKYGGTEQKCHPGVAQSFFVTVNKHS